MPSVTLLSWTPNPESVVAIAARVCYSTKEEVDQSIVDHTKAYFTGTTEDKEKLEKKNNGFIRKLREMNHLSPFEHASFTFVIDGISRACSHQLVRHRIASYSQRSQRYVSEENFNLAIPTNINSDESLKKVYLQAVQTVHEAYKELTRLGVPQEDARYILPNACETIIVVTMNARSLLHFFEQRMCHRAQWEIREVAEAMLELVRKVAPVLFEKTGAPCETTGACPEGKMSCGRWNFLGKEVK